jgi:hypothetical protein
MPLGLDAEQMQNVETIIAVGKQMGATAQDIAIAIMTSMDESSLHNLPGGDRDSAGLFQQRPSQGWGSYQQVTNPVYSSTQFYKHLLQVSNRDTINPWMAAQSVQNSGFPDGSNYEAYWKGPAHGFQVSAPEIYAQVSKDPNASKWLAEALAKYGGKGSFGNPNGPPLGFDSNVEGFLNTLGNTAESGITAAQKAVTTWQAAVEAVGAVFTSILWIFNIDHFMQFLLYVFGAVAIGSGLSMVTFGGGKETSVA